MYWKELLSAIIITMTPGIQNDGGFQLNAQEEHCARTVRCGYFKI